MTHSPAVSAPVTNELTVMQDMLSMDSLNHILELGCGNARLAQELLTRYPNCRYIGMEVDERQHALNVTTPQVGMTFLIGGAQAIDLPDQCCDLVLMLKSLHHVPIPEMDKALQEISRVLRPDGHLYVSEPVYAGALNDVVRLYNDEGVVRAAAQAALDRALAARESIWRQVAERRFEMPVHFKNFNDFELRMMRPTYADHRLDETKIEQVRTTFLPHCGTDGAHFTRPMHVRLFQRKAGS